MKIVFTKHAEQQIKERKIERIWVEETLKAPDKIYKEDEKYYAHKKLNDHTIEVVYEKQTYIKVITTYWL